MSKLRTVCALAALATTSAAAMAQGIVYAFDLRFEANSNLFSFPVNDPAMQTQIGPIGDPSTLGYRTFAMDFNTAGSVLHVIDHSPGLNAIRMGTVDIDTGAFTAGPTITGATFQGTNPTGLSVDPTNETFYASHTNQLFTINPITGVASSVGSFLDAAGAPIGTVIDIAVDNNGNLFAHVLGTGAGGGSLWAVDKNTGVSSLVGFSGVPTNFAQGMDFDPTTNLLYAALYTSGGNGSYGIWDTTDGSWTEIMPLIDFPDPSSNGRELVIAIRIPTPSVMAVLGLGGVFAVRRRR